VRHIVRRLAFKARETIPLEFGRVRSPNVHSRAKSMLEQNQVGDLMRGLGLALPSGVVESSGGPHQCVVLQ